MESLCRLCMTSSSSLKSAFSLSNGRLVVDLISIICPFIRIERADNLPEKICLQCLKIIKDAVELREKSVQSDQKLRTKAFASNKNLMPEVVKIKVEDDPISGNTIYFEKEDIYEEPEEEEEEEGSDEELNLISYEPKAKRSKINSFPCKQTRCRMKFSSKLLLDKHFRLAHREKVHLKARGNLPVECETCGLVLAHRTNLNRHIKRRHDPNLSFECSQCTYRFDKEHFLRAHITKEHTPKRASTKREFVDQKYCEECEEAFETENDLIQHLSDIHNSSLENSQLFDCEFCQTSFTMQHNLMRHYRTVHNDRLDYECKICFRKFKADEYLQRHMVRIHELDGDIQPTGEEFKKCCICRQTFNGSKYRFERHMIALHADDIINKEGGIYECDWCGKKFIFIQSLRLHVDKHRRSAAEQNLKYKCEGCSRRFKDEKRMRHHSSIAHKKISSNFICYICGQAFTNSKTRFEIHMKRHAGIFDFQCHLCPLKYASARDLDRHLTSHSDRRPYECIINDCKMKFKSRDVWRRHIKRQHQLKNEKKK